MKRQPLILAGTALGLLMASAPLGAFPLQGGADYGMAKGAPTLPLILAQADCQPDAGEDCTPKRRKHREKAAPAEQEQNAAPAEEQEQKPRRKKQREAEPAAEQQMTPEAQPEQNAAPAEQQEEKPRRKKKKEAAEPAPEQQMAPEAQPEQNAAPAEQQEQKPRRKKQKEATEPAPAEQASPGVGSEQPSAGKAETGSKQDKLRNYLKKKQGKEAPTEAQQAPSGEEAPKPEQKPDEESAPKPEQKPAEATQPPAQNEQPSDQAGEPKSKKEKLRDYLKKKESGEATPAETEPADKAQQPAEEGSPTGQEAERPKDGQPAGQAGEAPNNGAQAEGEAGQGAQPQLPADTREQAMPKPRARKGKRPENEAPLPDSAKNGRPAGESNQAGQPQTEQPQAEQPQAGGRAEAVPRSDSAAQTDIGRIGRIESVEAMKGKRLDREQWLRDQRKWREGNNDRNGGRVVNEIDNRYIVKYGDNIYVDNRGSNVRLERNARDSYVEELPGNFTRYTIVKDDGIRIVTVRNSYGDIVRRSRILPDNREVILYYVPESDYSHIRRGYYDAGADLPPLRLDIPADEYILDAQYAEPDDYYTYLDAPPVEPVERIYSVDEVVHSARIRDKVRRIDLDTITFDTGSAEIGEDQVNHLEALGDAINRILKQNPAETFLIEGHTDAVGSDESNLVLSDERAQSVAEALTSVFDIPAENLTTQGYGERYLKVNTQGASRDNRRVAVRRITPLVAPVASAK